MHAPGLGRVLALSAALWLLAAPAAPASPASPQDPQGSPYPEQRRHIGVQGIMDPAGGFSQGLTPYYSGREVC